MKANPVYLKESRSSLRSVRTIVILMAFNGLLAAAGILSLYIIVEQRRGTGVIYYSEFLQMYVVLAYMEMLFLLFIMPALTATSISGERERQTLDIMLCTKMKPVAIVIGKLQAAVATTFLILLSSMPVLALVFIFGGVQFIDLLYLMMVMFVIGCLVGSAGILFSALTRKNILSMAASYLWMIFITVGTLTIVYIIRYAWAATHQGMVPAWPSYLLLCNPAVTFYIVVNEQAGDRGALPTLLQNLGAVPNGWITEQWVPVSLVIQMLIAMLLLWMAARLIDPLSGKSRKRGEEL
ncbi:ABC transporter permease [Cuneatibacter caecimuris]|uniref:ABC-2 family transporter n=1 Tax=Cuneatibacter caecimuris TaxID=1796618 RepID=A0A4Q7PR90_9FIRM|nr:ABC transporter permease subunit [Cuneatibacter caecimuris]RZT02856.1 ABC-2 family transporter [Cuneatibacter caecimuris]